MAIITVSRGSFSGGKAVAEKLAERLWHPVLGREEVLKEAAQDYGVEETELISTLNETPSFWRQVPGKRIAYVKCVTAALLGHASGGNLIYHGNVGHLLLSDVPYVLRVRVIADMDFRVASAVEQLGVSHSEALAHIRRADESRSRWAQLLYGVDWQDPSQYTVVLNLAQIGVDAACETIARMAELDDFVADEEGAKAFADAELSARVWGALAKDPKARSAGIDVSADGGEILIQGSVGSTKSLDLLTEIAGRVEGVTSVRNEAGMGAGWYW